MPLVLGSLKPYQSFILAEIRQETDPKALVGEILSDLKIYLKIQTAPEYSLLNQVDAQNIDMLVVGILHYSEERPPTWTYQTGMLDRLNHLAVVCVYDGYVAIYLSESKRKGVITSSIRSGNGIGLGKLEVISPDQLNAAFVQGPARTLWLSGTHRRTTIKADNKILSGLDLRDAIDPLGDQTYYFTAARCVPLGFYLHKPVGVAPRKSHIWMGASRSWDEFLTAVTKVLSRLEETSTSLHSPFPILAVSASDPNLVYSPFDIALIPPEIYIDDPTMDAQERQEMELWGYYSNIKITQINQENNSFDIEISREGQLLGEANVSLDIKLPNEVDWVVTEKSIEDEFEDLYWEAISMIRRKTHIKIWLESGHTISDGEIFEVRHRDMPFDDIVWANLLDFEVGREKPDPLQDVGNQKSLFDWMLKYWPNLDASEQKAGGWLACDDGSMEMADFIHLDETVTPAVLSLIHVKASGSSKDTRQISVSDYEVVTGQAVKNLRYLDRICLAEGLSKGLKKKIGTLVWNNRVSCTRDDMIDALDRVKDNYVKRVYVFQPRLTRSMVEQARKNKTSSEYARLRQLDTLLLSAASSCKGMGVEFKVIGEDVEVAS